MAILFFSYSRKVNVDFLILPLDYYYNTVCRISCSSLKVYEIMGFQILIALLWSLDVKFCVFDFNFIIRILEIFSVQPLDNQMLRLGVSSKCSNRLT